MGKKAKLKDLKPDPRNANLHSPFGMGLLENSTRDLGLGRSILISSDNVIIAGNGVAEAAGSIGIDDVEVVESDGRKIVAVRRTDIKSGTPEFQKMALADNIVGAKNLVLDAEVIDAIAEEIPESKFWTELAYEIIDPKRIPREKLRDNDKANLVQATFSLSSKQSADLQKALKICKQVHGRRFASTDNKNSNGNALFFIVEEFINKYADTLIEE